MKRRQFLKHGAAFGSAFLARDTVSFASRDLGLGEAGASMPSSRTPPRSDLVAGRVERVDGATVTVDLEATQRNVAGTVVVVRREYPTGDVLSRGVSDRVALNGAGLKTTTHVDVPRQERTPGAWFYEAYVRAESDDERHAYLAESSPYQWRDAEGTAAMPADRVTDALPPASGKQFSRFLDGNEYVLTYEWQDFEGDVWTVDYRLRRSVHEAAVAAERGYVTTYEESLSSAVASDFANAIMTEARRRDRESRSGETTAEQVTVDSLDPARQFDVLVQFVQGIRYASDSETLGQYDYNRTVEETLAAGVGDCQELTYLLAGLLASAFDAETALLFQAGHVFLGVEPADARLLYDVDTLSVNGKAYVPIEPSLQVPVGYYPDEPLIAAYDDGWQYVDPGAMAEGIGPTVREWLASSNLVPDVL